VECDEVYSVSGHKGFPEKVKEAKRSPRCRRLKGSRGRGTLAADKPPIQRTGEVVIKMLENVKQVTIKPLIKKYISESTLIYTDEYAIYSRLTKWGYQHKTVNHSVGEYACDEEGDGFHEVHANTMEGFWSLLRSWLRPHRGISQTHLPHSLSFFEFSHNVKKRGKHLLPSMLELLLL
jgi:transposase-like protein